MAITSKTINIWQLDKELGSKGLSFNFNDPNNKIIKPADGSPITEAQLETAIANHVAQPTEEEIIELNKQQGIAKLKELGFTEEQITALIGGN